MFGCGILLVVLRSATGVWIWLVAADHNVLRAEHHIGSSKPISKDLCDRPIGLGLRCPLDSFDLLQRSIVSTVRTVDWLDVDAIEVFTDHPLNDGYAGWRRNCRQSFWPQPAYRLEPTESGVEVMARLTDYGDNDLGPCMTAYENPLGGRVVVLGHSPWQMFHNLFKSRPL